MGQRIVEISGDFLSWMHRGEHHYRVTDGALPADVKILNVRLAFPTKVELLIESEEWSPVIDGGEIPRHDVIFESIYKSEG